jgi:hypothetical protein
MGIMHTHYLTQNQGTEALAATGLKARKKLSLAEGMIVALVLLSSITRTSASLSQSHFYLAGELAFSSFKDDKLVFSETRQCEISRDGENLKIATWPSGSNYPACVFLSGSNSAITYVQYFKEVPDLKSSPDKGWNNGSAWISEYRMPEYMTGKLSPLWLMMAGHKEFLRSGGNDWTTPFGDLMSYDLTRHPTVTPNAKSDGQWPDGFSHYSDTLENENHTLVQYARFDIISWTNCSGFVFPLGFESIIEQKDKSNSKTRSAMKFSFTVDVISDLSDLAWEDMSVPLYSEVFDLRVQGGETLGKSLGITYSTTNGLVYNDPAEVKKLGVKTYPLLKAELKSTPPDKRIPLLILLLTVIFFPAFLLVRKCWLMWFSPQTNGNQKT